MNSVSDALSPALTTPMSLATRLPVANNYYAQPLLKTITMDFNLSFSQTECIITMAQLG